MWTFGFYFKEILSIKIKTANIFFHFLLLKQPLANSECVTGTTAVARTSPEVFHSVYLSHVSVRKCIFFLKPELTSSLSVCGQNPRWNKLEGARMLTIWAVLHVSLGTTATPSQLKTTHSTPFFLPDRTAVRRHTRSTHKHTLSVLVSSAPLLLLAFMNAVNRWPCLWRHWDLRFLTVAVVVVQFYLFFSPKAHTAVIWKALNPVTVYFSAVESISKFIRFRGEVFIKYFKQT